MRNSNGHDIDIIEIILLNLLVVGVVPIGSLVSQAVGSPIPLYIFLAAGFALANAAWITV